MFECVLDAADRTAYVTASGSFTLAEAVEAMRRLGSELATDPKFAVVVDLRASDTLPALEEVGPLATAMAESSVFARQPRARASGHRLRVPLDRLRAQAGAQATRGAPWVPALGPGRLPAAPDRPPQLRDQRREDGEVVADLARVEKIVPH